MAGTQPAVAYEYYQSTAVDANGTLSPLNHAMRKYTLPRGNGMTFEYYANGRVFRHTNTLGETNTFTYNDFRRESVQTNERGHTRQFFFDPNGNPLRIVEENGGERNYTYECLPDQPNNCANPFNRTSKREPGGLQTGYTYDAQGNVTTITQPSGATVVFSDFNAFNQPGKVKDPRGNYTLYKRDANGNVLQAIALRAGVGEALDPATYSPNPSDIIAWSINTYDAYGNLTSAKRVKDFGTQAGPTITYTYDAQGYNLVSLTRSGVLGNGAQGSETATFTNYDALGRMTAGARGDFYPVQTEYDTVDRITKA